MIATIHVVPVIVLHRAVMLAMISHLPIIYITHRGLQRLRCNQYKNGQKNVFHNTIIHLYAILDVFL